MNKNRLNLALFVIVVLISAAVANADYSNAVMSLNPVAYWPLQETNQPPSDFGTNLGSAGSAYNGYYLPGVGLGVSGALAGSADTAASFTSGSDEGAGGFLDVPYASAIGVTPPFTVEAWLNSAANDNTYCALAGGQFGSPRSGWLIYNNAGVWNFRLYNQNGTTPSLSISSGASTVGTWYHVVAICDAAMNGELYVNGVLVASNTAAGYVADPNGDLTIGARSDNSFGFKGSIDEVAIYPTALSASDILAHYQNGINPSRSQSYNSLILADNPLFYYRLDEPTPPAIAIATNHGSFGSAINGTYLPGTQPGTPGPLGIGFGATNYACTFTPVGATGNGGYVDCTANPALNITNVMSVVAWFKGAPADNRFQSFLGKSDNAWRADLDPNNAHWADGGGNGDAVGATSVNDGNWHFYAGVYDGANNYVYIDGVLDGESSASPGFSGDPNRHVILGGVGDYNGRNFLGSLSQVAVFTNALSAAQITALFDDASSLVPEIVQDPQSQAVNLGGTVTLSAAASGYPIFYRWYLGSTPLSDVPGNILGSATANLTITNASGANAGSYTLVVTNSFGSVTSQVATLTVYSNVLITTDIVPMNAVLFAGGHATFSIIAGGASPITYQWYSNNVAVIGATTAAFSLQNIQAATSIYCVASNKYNTATSSVASATVIVPTAPYPATVIAANPVGFWRLNETNNPTGNNGTPAYDYWGGNNGIYTNVNLGLPGYNPSETNETSVQLGALAFANCMAYNIPLNVDFAAPSNSSSSFSIECWVNGVVQTTDAGIVSKGLGGGGEQFNLDTGNDITTGTITVHNFRFFVRDASGGTHGVGSSIAPDNNWHHLVGVCDETNGYVALYIDGVLIGTNTITPGSGILASGQSMKIGARPAGAVASVNANQFAGNMDDVAVYNYALSAAQVLQHFYSADIPAQVTAQPTNTVAGENGTAIFQARIEGTPPVTNQWYNSNGQPIAGATNTTLVLTDVQVSDNGSSYYLTTSNAFGGGQSQLATLTVVSGPPQIYSDVQSPFFAILGGSGSDSVLAYGTEPLSYQWRFNGANLADGTGISGSHSNVLTVADATLAEAGNYEVVISNGSGAVTSSPALFIVGSSPVQFNITGGGWQANGNAQISTNTLSLTVNNGGEASSFFYNYPQYIGAFHASWTYQDIGGGGADGSSFCIQNDPRGVSALGGGGGSLGVSGITPSAELEFNIYSPNGVGYAFLTDGATGAAGGVYLSTGNVNVAGGDPINVVLNYANGILAMSFSDAGTNFSTNVVVDLPAIVGDDTAYIGFTGADGGVASSQVITNFSFISIAPQAIQISGTNATISWPGAILGYQLQQNTNLATATWINVTNPDVILNSQHQVTVPIRGKTQFYRLMLQ